MTAALRDVLRYIRRAAPPPSVFTDGELLARFLSARDEAAFAALLGRHGPLVLSVCRRLLPSEQDAEDAFQATFLVLASKAGSVVKSGSLGCWLYGVAYRTALRVREAAARRRRFESRAASSPDQAAPAAEPQDWQALYAELERLPEKYRVALVLCDLQGRSRQEAAALLRLPEGTLSSRLATGRRMLGDRLTRRAVALPTGAQAALAAVPEALASPTSSMAALVAAGQLAAVEAPAALLAKGVLRAMVMTKLKFVLAAAAAVGLVMGGVSFRWGPTPAEAQTSPARETAKPLSELEALRQENELLKVNLRVLLEKVKRLEDELASQKRSGRPAADAAPPGGPRGTGDYFDPNRRALPGQTDKGRYAPAPAPSSAGPDGRPVPGQSAPAAEPNAGTNRGPLDATIGIAVNIPKADPRGDEGKARARDEVKKTIDKLRRQLDALEGIDRPGR